jgi:hypothetical protein
LITDTHLTFFPPTPDRADAIGAGFRFGHLGTHSSRTIMLEEVQATFATLPAQAKPDAYATAIIEENCLGKRTVSTRRLTLQRLRELYALDVAVPIFRILRQLWDMDIEGRPVLALLASLARDPLLLATAGVVISLPEGAEFQRSAMREALAGTVRNRFNESTLNKVVRNAASSWSQSGHLQGRTFKFRRMVRATPPSVAFALYVARAAGFRGMNLLTSGWIGVVDCTLATAKELALEAKRIGLIDVRMAGDVIEIGLDRLDPALGRGVHGAH